MATFRLVDFQDRLEEFVDSRGTIFVDVYRYTVAAPHKTAYGTPKNQ
jgi:hypothetical protein